MRAACRKLIHFSAKNFNDLFQILMPHFRSTIFIGRELKFGGGGRGSDGTIFSHFFNDILCLPTLEDPVDSPMINKYICFVTNYFCFYHVRVTNVHMHS